MANTKFSVFLCMILLLTLAIHHVAGSSTSYVEFQNRKFFIEKKTKMLLNGANGLVNNGKSEMTEDWKRVPAGPDPMHHHGQDPKPRIP